MAIPIRKPPGPADQQNPRAQEYFQQDVYHALRLVGTRSVDLGSISAGAVTTFTITVTGARTSTAQTVQIAAPSTIDAGLVWCGLVSADDTVTVRVHNTTGSPIDPAEATWGARVMP